MNAKYDKAPARKIGVSNITDAVTGEKIIDKVAINTAEADKSVLLWLKEIYLKLDSIDKNLRIMNEIDIGEEI